MDIEAELGIELAKSDEEEELEEEGLAEAQQAAPAAATAGLAPRAAQPQLSKKVGIIWKAISFPYAPPSFVCRTTCTY